MMLKIEEGSTELIPFSDLYHKYDIFGNLVHTIFLSATSCPTSLHPRLAKVLLFFKSQFDRTDQAGLVRWTVVVGRNASIMVRQRTVDFNFNPVFAFG